MVKSSNLTVLIITYNEELNIGRVLDSLIWARNILIVDSFSNDNTIDIINQFENVRLVQNKFINFADQCNFGLSLILTDWVLSIDSDYIISLELHKSVLDVLSSDNPLDGYQAKFKYCINGVPLRSSLLPPRTVLYKKSKSKYVEDGHAHRVVISGNVGPIYGVINHDDRKPLSHWLNSQSRYADSERIKLLSVAKNTLSMADRIRLKIILAPFIILIYCLILKGCLFDGKNGWYYSFQRMYFEVLLSLKLMEAKLGLWKLDESA